jgi:hypothetical protein
MKKLKKFFTSSVLALLTKTEGQSTQGRLALSKQGQSRFYELALRY